MSHSVLNATINCGRNIPPTLPSAFADPDWYHTSSVSLGPAPKSTDIFLVSLYVLVRDLLNSGPTKTEVYVCTFITVSCQCVSRCCKRNMHGCCVAFIPDVVRAFVKYANASKPVYLWHCRLNAQGMYESHVLPISYIKMNYIKWFRILKTSYTAV